MQNRSGTDKLALCLNVIWGRNGRFLIPSSTYRWGIVLLILLAFGLRLHNAEQFSFWTDEGLTPLRSGYTVSTILSNEVTIQEGVTEDTHPPLFFLIIHFSRQIFGESDFAYRFPSLLAGVLLLPLLAAVGRQMRSRWLGIVVAGLTAVNPLQIWYANEARMYTIAILLVTAASYLLWRLIAQANRGGQLSPQVIRKHLIYYLLLMGLATYTLYTTVLLILGQAIFWLILLWRQGHKRLLLGTAVLGVIISAPLIPYTIPRLFSGYEANFYYVSPWIMLQDVIRFFALGRSVDFESAPIIGLNIGIFLLLLVGLWQANKKWQRPFLLIWLLALVFGLMIGSIVFKPMYQGVRHIMLGSPAFLLLLGFGIVGMGERVSQVKQMSRLVWGLGLILGLCLVTIGPIIALNNYYNGRYGKDDFHSLIEFIEARAGENDIIVYNNAILLPLHDHYQQRDDLAVTASPIYPKWANTSPPQLAQLAQMYDRIWFVTDPPADRRDDNRVVRQWLNDELLLVDSTFFVSITVEVLARVYDTKPLQATNLPENGRPLNIQWQNYPQLVGAEWRVEQPVTQPAIWLDLFWQGPPPDPTHGLRFELIGPHGSLGWQVVETAVDRGNQPWQPTSLNRRSYFIPLPTGTPPGQYTVRTQPLLLQETPQILAEPTAIGDIKIAPDTTSRPEWPTETAKAIFENGVTLQELTLADTAVRPGHSLPIILFWQIDDAATLTDLQYELTVTAEDGTLLRSQRGLPGASWLTEWQSNQRLREPNGLYFPPDTLPGTYKLEMQLLQVNETVQGRPFWWPFSSERVTVGEVEVTPWPLETNLPADVIPVEAQFGNDIQLYGYDLAIDPAALALTLHWQANAMPSTNWSVFVHLVDGSDNIVAQRDVVPAEGLRPASGWRASEVIQDVHLLPLPPDLPAGPYSLRVGLFEPESFLRPSVTYNNQPQPDNQLILTELTLP